MNKHAMEMATGTIVSIVLGLIILVILIIFAQQQVTKGGQKFEGIQSEADYAPDKCGSIIKGTFCADRCAQGYKPISSPTGKWKDCTSPKVCCQKE